MKYIIFFLCLIVTVIISDSKAEAATINSVLNIPNLTDHATQAVGKIVLKEYPDRPNDLRGGSHFMVKIPSSISASIKFANSFTRNQDFVYISQKNGAMVALPIENVQRLGITLSV